MHRGIIEHVSNSEPFLDSKTSYYRFRPEKTRQINVWYPDEKITYLIDMMRLNLEFKTRTWRLTKYKKTFKGGDLVDWLTKHLKLSREDAVAFGEEMMRRSIFHHVTFSEPFDDEPNLFRFYQDEKKYRTATRAKLRQSTLSADRVRSQSAQGSSGSGSFTGGVRPVSKVSSGRDVRERYRDV